MSMTDYRKTPHPEHIEPCPFCGATLVEVTAFTTRLQATYAHPPAEEEECVIGHVRVILSDREEDKARLAKWNTRK